MARILWRIVILLVIVGVLLGFLRWVGGGEGFLSADWWSHMWQNVQDWIHNTNAKAPANS